MSNTIISSGIISSGLSILLGDVVSVLNGGEANLLTIGNGGEILVSPGGLALGTEVNSGGLELVVGGLTIGANIASGGVEAVVSGGTANLALVNGLLTVASGAATSGALVTGGTEIVSAGGSALASVLTLGGNLVVLPGGNATGTVNVLGNVVSTGDALLSNGNLISAVGTLVGQIIGTTESALVLSGGNLVSATINSGGVAVVFGGGTASGLTVNLGALELISSGGTVTSDVIQLGGTQIILSGGIASGTIVSSGGVQVLSGGGLTIDTNLLSGGTLDLAGLGFTSGGSAVLDTVTDVLTVIEGGVDSAFQLVGNLTGLYAYIGDDGHGGTEITLGGTPCYCRGTAILTDQGEIPVEALRIGDGLVTASGAVRPLRWIGRRSYAGAFAANNRAVLPILFRVGCLGENLPRCDLLVSPLHAMFLQGVLIPAHALVNGTSVVQLEAVTQVEYFHLELETHDVILAEGVPSESFVDDQSRGMFQNSAEYRMLYPAAECVVARYCAPRLESGPEVTAARRAITALHALAPLTEGRLEGQLDSAAHNRLTGWARDAHNPGVPVRLCVFVDDVAVGEIFADQPRADLRQAGFGTGRHGFNFEIPVGLPSGRRHVVVLKRSSDMAVLANTPHTLAAAPALDAAKPSSGALSSCQGYVEHATRGQIAGWVWDAATPDAPVWLQVLDNGQLVTRVLANIHRADLQQVGLGDGCHGFDVRIPGGLSPLARHVIQLRCEADGMDLTGSPMVIEPVAAFDADLQATVAAAVAALETDGDRARVLSFIAAQADRLLHVSADPAMPAKGANQLRALVIDSRVPVPGRDAGSQAILSHMRALGRLGYEVSFVAADQIDNKNDAALENAGVIRLGAPSHISVEEVLRRQAGQFDVVYLHRGDIAARYLSLVRFHLPQARILYNVADLHHLRLERQARVEQRAEAIGMDQVRQAEIRAAAAADAVITHSRVELQVLARAVPQANLHCIGWEVPRYTPALPLGARHGIAFIGGYTHAPNLDAARYLVEQVMPLVWEQEPSIACALVGSDMPDTIRRLARPGVRVLGRVTDLGRDLFDKVRLTVAPLRFGAGIKGKVLESFAAGTPCVMSEVAAEGLQLCPTLQALIGRDAAEIAALIIRLHQDDAAHEAAVSAGAALLNWHCDQQKIDAALAAAINAEISPLRQKAC